MKEVIISLRFLHGINQLALPNFNLSFYIRVPKGYPIFLIKKSLSNFDKDLYCYYSAFFIVSVSSSILRFTLPFPE